MLKLNQLLSKTININFKRQYKRLIAWSLFMFFFITVGLPLMFFYYWFDAAKVKQIVISQFDKQNYSVVVNGSVEPRSWHGLSLFISNLTVLDKSGHKILHLNTANCQLSWLDLIIGHYKIRRIAFNGVTFYKTSVNNINYAAMLDYRSLANSEFNNLNSLSVTNLNLVEAENNYILRDAAMQLYDIASSQPSFHLEFKVARYHAFLNLSGMVSKIQDNTLLIDNLNTTVVSPHLSLEFQSRARYAYQEQRLWLEATKGVINSKSYNGSVGIDTILISSYGLMVNNITAVLNNPLKNYNQTLSLSLNKVLTNSFNQVTADKINIKYEAANINHQYRASLELNEAVLNQDLNLLNNDCRVEVAILYSDKRSVFNSLLKGACNFYPQLGTAEFNLQGRLNDAQSQLQLKYAYTKNVPFIDLIAKIGDLDLTSLATSSSTPEILPLYSDTSPLPLGWLNLFDLHALVAVHQLKVSGLAINNFSTSVDVKKSKLNLSKLDAMIYGGKLTGNIQIAKVANAYNLVIDNKFSDINLKNLFASLFNVNAISGNANLIISANAESVVSYEDLHKKLNGSVKLQVNNGGFSGVDFSLFLSPENLAAFQNRNVMMTRFTQLEAGFTFVNGKSAKSYLEFNSPTIAASGSGLISFAENQIDYKLNVSSILPLNMQKIKSISIPVEINGELFSPKIYIQNMTLNTETKRQSKASSNRKRRASR